MGRALDALLAERAALLVVVEAAQRWASAQAARDAVLVAVVMGTVTVGDDRVVSEGSRCTDALLATVQAWEARNG